MSDFIKILDERLSFYEGSLTEAVYLKEVNEELLKWGKFENGKYIPNNPNMFLGIMIDHMTLVKASGGRTRKMKLMQFLEILFKSEIILKLYLL